MTYDLKLSTEMLQVLDKALQELPFRLAAPIIAEINKQIAEQQKPQSSEQ